MLWDYVFLVLAAVLRVYVQGSISAGWSVVFSLSVSFASFSVGLLQFISVQNCNRYFVGEIL